MGKRYELMPKDGRKSFYGKAFVEVENDGSEILYSYNTRIMRARRDENGDTKFTRILGGWSATTGRHIASFSGLNKKGFEALEMEE